MWKARLRRLIAPAPPAWTLLRRTLAQEQAARGMSAEERLLAQALTAQREALARAFGQCEACGRCAHKRPLPHGRWAGGFCCGAPTEELFTADEIAALALAGTRAHHLHPRPAEAGCLFRSATGCVLPPRHRPVVCLTHICRELEQELALRGDLQAIEAQAARLQRRFSALIDLRRRRLDRQWLDKLR